MITRRKTPVVDAIGAAIAGPAMRLALLVACITMTVLTANQLAFAQQLVLSRILDDPTPTDNDFFGALAAATDGNLVLIGAHGDDSKGNKVGQAHLFEAASGHLIHTFDHPSPTTGRGFDRSVALDGSRVLIGESNFRGGQAHLFDADSGGFLQSFDSPLPGDPSFGTTVAMDGGNALITSQIARKAHVFDAISGDILLTIDDPNPLDGGGFGGGVAMDGNLVLINGDLGDGRGVVHLFDLETGSLLRTFDDPTPTNADGFGSSFDFDQDRVVIGAVGDDTNGHNRGQSHIFDITSGDLLHTFDPPRPATTRLGNGVALDGGLVVLGTRADGVHVYDVVSGDFLYSLDDPDPSDTGFFGGLRAVHGGLVVVGTEGHPHGRAYVYTIIPEPSSLLLAACGLAGALLVRRRHVAGMMATLVACVVLCLPLTTPVSAKQAEFLFAYGSEGEGPGQFRNPLGIAFDDDNNAYVGDQTNPNGRVQVFNDVGDYLWEFSTLMPPHEQLGTRNPNGIAFASTGDIYVSTQWNDDTDSTRVFDGTGAFQFDFGSSGFQIAVDEADRLFVGNERSDKIEVFNAAGDLLYDFGSPGSGQGQFEFPIGVGLDIAGNVYVSDASQDRVQVFDNLGVFQYEFGSTGTGDGQLDEPGFLAVDGNSHVYVPDSRNDRVQAFDLQGNFAFAFGSRGTGPGEFSAPSSVAVDKVGRLHVVEYHGRRVQVFSIIPEPSSLLLAASGLTGVLLVRRRSRCRLASFGLGVVLYACVATTALSSGAAEFIPLGFVGETAESILRSRVFDMSADGSVVTGRSSANVTDGDVLFRWTRQTGMAAIEDGKRSGSASMSDDGSTIVWRRIESPETFNEVWSVDAVQETLPDFGAHGAGNVSVDGTFTVGSRFIGSGDFPMPTMWSSGTGFVDLDVADGVYWGVAGVVTPDGSVAAGMVATEEVTYPSGLPFRWTPSEGMRLLTEEPGHNYNQGLLGMTADGGVIVGESGMGLWRWTAENGLVVLEPSDAGPGLSRFGRHLSQNGGVIGGMQRDGSAVLRWTAEDDFQPLPTPDGYSSHYFADMSADGRLFLGASGNGLTNVPWLWSEATGLREFPEVLIEQGLETDIAGWRLISNSPLLLSDDGRTVSGTGINPDGVEEAWVAYLDPIPEPSSLLLATIGLAGVSPVRRRQQTK